MNINSAIEEHYASLDDDDLRYNATMRELTDEARLVLEHELQRRGINDLSEYKAWHEEQKRLRQEQQERKFKEKCASIRFYARIGYVFCAVGLIAGTFDYFILGNKQNGTGTMIASLVVAPVVWAGYCIRKTIWRFLLRP